MNDIGQIRRDLHLNQVQFSELFGIHPMTVSKWERDVLEPNPYQKSLMEEFRKAASDPEVQQTLKAVLIGAGVAAALYLILKATRA